MRIMTFNIRYPEPADGVHVWELRRALTATVIDECDADAVGLQEPVIDQLRYLDEALPRYRRFGVSRYGNEKEKFTAILFKTETVALDECGVFWYSETPDVPCSMSWLIHKPYAVNWGRLRHRPSGRCFHLFNTHFPYKPEQAEARLHAARLLRDRAGLVPDPVWITGDFNSPAGGDVHQILREACYDAWHEASRRLGPEGTMHGFTGQPRAARIDWILFRGDGIAVETIETVTTHDEQRYPSDHFPVVATFAF